MPDTLPSLVVSPKDLHFEGEAHLVLSALLGSAGPSGAAAVVAEARLMHRQQQWPGRVRLTNSTPPCAHQPEPRSRSAIFQQPRVAGLSPLCRPSVRLSSHRCHVQDQNHRSPPVLRTAQRWFAAGQLVRHR
jgi:hypothetical protein